jgi:hypothetical protein
MKQKDLTVILITVFISAVISIFLSKAFISSPKNRHEQVEVVTPIDSTFPEPDKKYFNENSVDPTKNISIGDNNNKRPFNNQNQ